MNENTTDLDHPETLTATAAEIYIRMASGAALIDKARS